MRWGNWETRSDMNLIYVFVCSGKSRVFSPDSLHLRIYRIFHGLVRSENNNFEGLGDLTVRSTLVHQMSWCTPSTGGFGSSITAVFH